MNVNEMIDRYHHLYGIMAVSGEPSLMHIFGEAEKRAFGKMVELSPSYATAWLEILEAVGWNNYLTKMEAEGIVAKLHNQDGTIGGHWDYEVFKSAVEALGAPMCEEPFFNCWALWATANMLYSDHAESVSEFVEESDHPKFFYLMAVEKLKDADRKHFIRPYYKL